MVRNDMFYTQYPYMPEAEQETNLLVSVQEFGMGAVANMLFFVWVVFFLKKHVFFCWCNPVFCLSVLSGW